MLLTKYSSLNSISELITVLIIFVFVLAITYYTTRWIANYQKESNHCKNLEIIETYKITTNKYLQIVRVGEKFMVIAVCKDTVTFLCELQKDQIDLNVCKMNNNQQINFKELLEKAKKIKK